jgi:hypothetical protein
MSLGEFVSSGISVGVNNGQTRWLAGDLHAEPFGAAGTEMLAAAKRNIEEHFSLVGLTERFDETLLLIRALLGWRLYPFYRRENVARSKHKTISISEEDVAVVRAFNHLDLELYRFAYERFERQIGGTSIPDQLAAFRRWNGYYRVVTAPFNR